MTTRLLTADFSTVDYRLINPVVHIIGAGYIGLVAACCLANSGHQVTCVEANEAKLKLLNQGLNSIQEKVATMSCSQPLYLASNDI